MPRTRAPGPRPLPTLPYGDRLAVLRLAARTHPSLLAAALATSLLGAILPLASMAATGSLVDDVGTWCRRRAVPAT